MRTQLLIAAAVGAAVMAVPAVAQADTGTADLAITRLTIAVHNNTVTVRAEAADLGPDGAEPAIQLEVTGGTVKRAICTFNRERVPNSSDGDTCNLISTPDLTDTVGMIVKMRISRPARVGAVATVYDLGSTTDPVTSNNTRYRSRLILH